MFKIIGNRLYAHGNRLLFCKSVWKECWLLIIDYCLLVIDYQRVKLLIKDFFLWKILLDKLCYSIFSFEKIFLYLSWCFSWRSCISWVFSWIFTLILNLDWTTLWFLILAWHLILDLSLWHHQNKLGKLCFHT